MKAKSCDWSVEVVTKDLSKEVILGIGRCLWIDFQPINVVWEKYKQHFGELGDFLIVLGRLANYRNEIVNILTNTKQYKQ